MRFALILIAATLYAQAPPPAPVVRITPEERHQIEQKADELDAVLKPMRGKVGDDYLVDVEVFSKAYAAQTLAVLDTGMQRAQQLATGHPVWQKRTGSFVRAYRSRVDGSIQ